jgi:L-alanine-DL-glutamate epimerase-like enolase superfamily enzyme
VVTWVVKYSFANSLVDNLAQARVGCFKSGEDMNFKIEEAWFSPRSLSLRMPFAISKGTLESADNVYFFLKDSNGNIGLGEAAPFPVLTFDDQLKVTSLADLELRSFIGLSTDQALSTVLGDFRKKYYRESPTFLTGLEMALWDLRAKQMGAPLARLFGPKNLMSMSTDITLPIMNKSEVTQFWNTFSKYGFSEVKVKVGGRAASEDADRVEEIYQLSSSGVKISLDGNQGCTVDSSLELVANLKKRGIHPVLFEQPLSESDFNGMKELCQKSSIPICADEMVKTSQDAIRVVQLKSCDMINLKIMKSGITEAVKIAQVAKSAGLGLMIGGMLESEVAMTTSLHIACGTGMIDWLDLDTPFFMSDSVTAENPWAMKNATLLCPQQPGLGLTFIS